MPLLHCFFIQSFLEIMHFSTIADPQAPTSTILGESAEYRQGFWGQGGNKSKWFKKSRHLHDITTDVTLRYKENLPYKTECMFMYTFILTHVWTTARVSSWLNKGRCCEAQWIQKQQPAPPGKGLTRLRKFQGLI